MKKIVVKKGGADGNTAATKEPTPRQPLRASVPQRTARAAGAPTQPPARRAPSSPRASREHGGSPNVPLLVAIGVIVVIVLIVGLAAGSRHRAAPPPPPQEAAAVPAERPREPARFDELGGKTMAEWMAENNKDNKALQERQNRLREARAGRTPQEDPVRKGSGDGNPHQ